MRFDDIASGQRTRFVGRRDVLQSAGAWLDALERGLSARVVITGPAGIGKTRLLIEVGRLARARDIAVIDVDAAGPFAPMSFRPAVFLYDPRSASDCRSVDEYIDLGDRVAAFPSLFLATLDDDDARRIDTLRACDFTFVHLRPLERDDIAAIAAQAAEIAGIGRAEDDFERIVDLASGHPRYATELAADARDAVPASIRERLATLERRYGAATLDVLTACAACVDPTGCIDLVLVRRIVPGGNITAALIAAKSSRLVDDSNRFMHGLIAAALVARLSDARRRRFDRRAARILSERVPSNATFLAIAEHLERAGDGPGAAIYFRLLASDSVVRGRPERAYDLYRRAIAAHGAPSPWLASTHREAARVARSLEESQAAIRHLEAALAIVPEAERDERAEVLIELARVHGIARDLPAAERRALQTLEVYKSVYAFAPQKYAVAAILANLANVRGDLVRMRKLVARCDEVMERLPTAIRWDALRMRAMLQLRESGGDGTSALVDLREAARLTIEAGMLYETSMVEGLLGQALFALGDAEGARDAFGRALEIAVRTGDRRRTHVVLFHLAELASIADDAVAMIAITRKLGGSIADPDLPWLSLSAARLGICVGDRTTQICRRDFERRADVQTRHMSGLAFARLAAHDGDDAAVPAVLETLADEMDRVTFNPAVDFVLLSARYGDDRLVRRARDRIERVESIRERRCGLATRALFDAWAARRHGDGRRMRDEARRAERAFTRVGWRIFANEAKLLGTLGTDDAADPDAARAARTARTVGSGRNVDGDPSGISPGVSDR